MASDFPLKAVIFDCDGILVDTEPIHYRAFQKVLVPLGMGFDYDRYLKDYIGFDDRDAFIEAFREAGRAVGGAELASLIKAKADALQVIISEGISSFPGVAELIARLIDHRVPLAVASGALRHEIDDFLAALNLSHAFPTIVAANDVKKSKPDPETYAMALEKVRTERGLKGLDARSCVAIKDTPAGIRSAKGAGLYVVAVTNSFPADRLTEADLVVESLEKVDVIGLADLVGRTNG
ncbi:MAG: HAD family hydrolase [Acidobacteriota bacterium]